MILSNIICLPDVNGNKGYYDFGTKNVSFLQTAQELKSLGIKHWYLPLKVKYPQFNITDIDPYDPSLDPSTIGKIHMESKDNVWYWTREVARIPAKGAPEPFLPMLTRASCALMWNFEHNIDFMVVQPRQTHKTTWINLLLSHAFIYDLSNAEIPMMHLQDKDVTRNVEMFRDYISQLPDYMNPWSDRPKPPGVKSIKYEAHKTAIYPLCQPDSEITAMDKLRGMTLFSGFIDEFEYINCISHVIAGAKPAMESGRLIAQQTGARCCFMYASTPGNLETPTGKEAQKLIDNTPKWSEKYYDLSDADVEKLFEHNIDEDGVDRTMIRRFYIEYNYKQLRKDDIWLEKQYKEAEASGDMAEYKRGYLLQRFRGTQGALFKQADIDYINQHVREPDDEILLLKKYHLYIYKHQVVMTDLNSDTPFFDITCPYMIGIDIAGGTAGDNTTFVVVHPYTFQVVAELASPYMGALDLIRCIIELAKLMPKAVFCPETNSIGKALLEWIQDSKLEYRFYCDPKLDITKNVTEDDEKDFEKKIKNKALQRKYIGTNVTPKIRENMMTLLRRYVHDYRHLINTKLLVNDINNLTIIKNKIQADNGTHDDIVMAYCHVLYVFTYGYDLSRYGIVKSNCTFEKAYIEVKNYELSTEQNHVNNMKPYGKDAYGYEEQLLHDIIDSNQNGFNKSGMDPYGYNRTQYNQMNNNDPEPVRMTRADLAFFNSVQNF